MKKSPGFLIHADGKTFGPYRSRFEDRITKLLHLKGITVEHVMVEPKEMLPPPRKREKKPENLSLLDGLDWMPSPRRL